MAAWPPLQDARAGEFWRQVLRKELKPWQADACRQPSKTQARAAAQPKPSLYITVYDAYSSKSTPPAHARATKTASGWSSSSAPSLKARIPTDAHASSRSGLVQGLQPALGSPLRSEHRCRPTELQPALGTARLLPIGMKTPPVSFGLSHHKTFGVGLSHNIPHVRSSLDLGNGQWRG